MLAFDSHTERSDKSAPRPSEKDTTMALHTSLVRVAGALGATVLALSLAACSGGQNVAEGCAIAQESLSAGVATSISSPQKHSQAEAA